MTVEHSIGNFVISVIALAFKAAITVAFVWVIWRVIGSPEFSAVGAFGMVAVGVIIESLVRKLGDHNQRRGTALK